MRAAICIIFFLLFLVQATAQKTNYDSIRKIMQQDSIEYEQQLKDANRIRNQTDSILKNDLGNIERITPGPDSAKVLKNLRELAAKEIEKQRAEDTKNYYLYAGAFAVLLIAVIIIFKQKQLAKGDGKKP